MNILNEYRDRIIDAIYTTFKKNIPDLTKERISNILKNIYKR